MEFHLREGWRTCDNCVHNIVCNTQNREKGCAYHIYNALSQRYGDIEDLLAPLYDWIAFNYPNDAKLIIDKNGADLIVEHKSWVKKNKTY